MKPGQEPKITGDALKAWRGRKKWTQNYAANAAGVDPRTWRRWENGERKAPPLLGRWMRAVDMIMKHGLRPKVRNLKTTKETSNG